MGDIPVVNTTRYDTDDVMSIVEAIFERSSRSASSVKIRYLRKPTHGFGEKKSWVKVQSEKGVLEIALLHPDKLPIPDMDQLARSTWSNVAHDQIAIDLEMMMWHRFYYCGERVIVDKRIRLHESENLDEKRISTHRNLKQRVIDKRKQVRDNRASLPIARKQHAAMAKRIAKLELKIPEREVELVLLEDRLEKSTAKMKAANLDES